MLLVKTYIGKSEISGIGLFAAEKIKKGQVFWKYDIIVDTLIEFKLFENKNYSEIKGFTKKEILHFAYTDNGCYKMCGDDAKYMNHSKNPNTESFNTEFEEMEIVTKDIEIGEELTCNYFKINDDYSREIFSKLER